MSHSNLPYQNPIRDSAKPQSRWPFTHNPKGWYVVSMSSELGIKEVKPLQYFGQDLVLFRDEEGSPQLLDAFCPHMGAHLGYGGKVEGCELVCPFHAWRFDGQGECKSIPYADKIPKRAQINPWEVCEKNGMIFAWCDEEGGGPEWDIPVVEEFGNDEWTEFETREWFIKSHNIEMGENQVDAAHFKYLHNLNSYPKTTCEAEGPYMKVYSTSHSPTPQGEVEAIIQSESWGFGFQVVRLKGIIEAIVLTAITPMDGEQVHTRFNFMIKKIGDVNVTKGVGKALINEVSSQFEQDKLIWENKIYLQPPNLVEGEAPLAVYRRWSKQFFPEGTF